MNKSFTPNSVVAYQHATLNIVLLNPNATPATSVALADTLPASVVVANPPNVSDSCGFTINAPAGSGTVGLSGGTIPAVSGGVSGQCALSIDVMSTVPSTYLNTITAGSVSSSQGANSQVAQATLVVSPVASITGSKVFSLSTLNGGGPAATLTITLVNPNAIPLTNTSVTDNLPSSITIAATPNAQTTCGPGAVATNGAPTPATIVLSGGTIPAGGSCTIKVDVIARSTTTFQSATVTNTIAANTVTTTEGATNAAISGSVVIDTGARILKSFSPSTVAPGGSSTMTVTIQNLNGVSLAPIAFTDSWVAGMSASPNTATTTCTGATISNTSNAFTIGSGSLGPASAAGGVQQCTITLAVTGTSTTANSIAVQNFGGIPTALVSATLTVSSPSVITGSKAFSTPAAETGATTMTITLNNSTSTAASITSVTDLLTTLGTGFTIPSGATVGGTCGASLTSGPGTTLTLAGGTIPANGSCTITVPVAIGIGASTGARTNSIAAHSVVTDQGDNAAAITGAVTVTRALTVTKAFVPTTVVAGTKSRLTVTLARANGAIALSQIAFTDNLTTMGAGFVVATPPNATTTCTNGTVTANAGATSFSLSGASLAVPVGGGSSSCTVAVDVMSPGNATAGAHTNLMTAGTVTTAEGPIGGDASGALTIANNATVTVNKSFSPTTVPVGSTSTMTVQIRNNNPNAIALAGVALSDTLPIGMVVANPPAATMTGTGCSAGSISAVNNATSVSVSGTAISAGAICSLAVTVRANAAGNLINTIPANAVTSTQGVTNPLQGTATLAATGTVNLSLTKTDGVASVNAGGATTYTIVVSNSGPNDLAGLQVDDAPPGGVTFGSWICAPSGGATCNSGSGTLADLVNIPVGGKITYTVPASIASNATGSITNTATLGVPGSVINNGVASASDTDTVAQQADLAVTKQVDNPAPNVGGQVTFTVDMTDNGPSDASGVKVNDLLPSGYSLVTATPTLGSYDAVTGLWTLGALTNGATATLTLVAKVLANGGYTNTATASSTSIDPDSSNDSASASTTPVPVADLAVSKVVDNPSPTVGTNVVFTVGVIDAGPSDAGNVVVTDALPAGYSLVSAVPSVGTYNAATGAWTVGSLVNGASANLALTTKVLASGPYANTATASSSTTDPNPGNNSATATPVPVPTADVSVTKQVDNATPNVGSNVVFTVTTRNNGPGDATGVSVADLLPSGYSFVSSAPAQGSYDAASGTWTIGALAHGASTTLQVTAKVRASGSYLNTASLMASTPADTTPANNSQSVAVIPVPVSSLAVTKDDGSTTYTPGGAATYTIVVTNSGPSDATSVTVADPLPAGVRLAGTVSCVSAGAATCGVVTGTQGQAAAGATGATISAGSGNSIALSVPVLFDSSLNAAAVTNNVTAKDPASADATASDTDSRHAQVVLAVTKDDGSLTYTPGGTATYLVTVTSTDLSDALDVTVADNLPAGVTLSAAATCAATGTASCGTVAGAAGQTSFGAQHASIASGPGNALTFSVPVAFAPSLTTSSLVNSVTATDIATGATASASDSDTRSSNVSLAVSKTDNSQTYTPGAGATYVVTVTNGGTSDAASVTVNDALPSGVTLSADVACTANGVASCGVVTGSKGQSAFGATGAVVGHGGASSIVFTVPVTFDPALATDPLVNTATANDLVSGAAGIGTDSDARSPSVTLVVVKDDGSLTYTPGQGTTYTVTVSNSGASDALDVSVSDALPPGVTLAANVVCNPTGAVSCGSVAGSTGQASMTATGARIDAGAGNKLTFSVPVAFASGMVDDPLINTATATDFASGATASGKDVDARSANVALAITKTDGSPTYTPGSTASYTITLANTGASDAVDVTVSDPLPAGVTLTGDATCEAHGGSHCGSITSGKGKSAFTASGAHVASGGANTLVYSLPVAFDAMLATGALVNTATATDAASGASASGSDIDGRNAISGLGVTKTDNRATYTPGGSAVYTIVVTNAGPGGADTISATDPLPTGVTLAASPTCVVTGTGACGNLIGAAGDSIFNVSMASLGAGSGNALTYTVPVDFAAGMTIDPLVNTVTVQAPSSPTVSASDTDARASGPPVGASPDLTISKTHSGSFVAGEAGGSFSLVVTNAGGVASSGTVTVTDALPSGLVATAIGGAGWTCILATSNCTRSDPLVPGASYPPIVVAVTVAAGASGTLVNRATVSGGGDTNAVNDSASDAVVVGMPTMPDLAPDLTLVKTHGGNFAAGQSDGTFLLTVSNIGNVATSGTITVVDTLPAGLTAMSVAGTGWTCILASVTCTRGDTLPPGARFAPIVVGVAVASSASGTLVNSAFVSGGGDASPANNGASDKVTIDALAADLAIVKTHGSGFAPGLAGVFTLTVSNVGQGATSGIVTVIDAMPSGMTAQLIGGSGWSCTLATLTCTRGDVLAPGASYPPIDIAVVVDANASGTLVNRASVSGGGDGNAINNAASDSVIVAPPTYTEDPDPIPALSPFALALLVVALAVVTYAERTRAAQTRR